jgi:hypothetical protein
MIHVCHNTTRGGQDHTEALAKFESLCEVLDERFETAERLVSKLRESAAPL